MAKCPYPQPLTQTLCWITLQEPSEGGLGKLGRRVSKWFVQGRKLTTEPLASLHTFAPHVNCIWRVYLWGSPIDCLAPQLCDTESLFQALHSSSSEHWQCPWRTVLHSVCLCSALQKSSTLTQPSPVYRRVDPLSSIRREPRMGRAWCLRHKAWLEEPSQSGGCCSAITAKLLSGVSSPEHP